MGKDKEKSVYQGYEFEDLEFKDPGFDKSILDNKYYPIINKLQLTQLYNGVKSLYDNLANLEKKGLKDTEEYNNLVDLIDAVLKIENEKFRKFDSLNSLELEAFIDQTVYCNNETEESMIDKTNLFKSDKVTRLIARIRDHSVLRVEPFGEFDEKDEKEIDPNKTFQVQATNGMLLNIRFKDMKALGFTYDGEIENEVTEENLDQIRTTNDAIYYKDKLVNLYFLKKIEEEINNAQTKSIKNLLIDYKYNLIYTFFSLESAFARKRDIDSEIYLTRAIINLLSQRYPDDYQTVYSDSLEYELQEKIREIKSKKYEGDFPSSEEKLGDKIDLLFIESLIESSIDIESLKNTKAFVNIASNEAENNVIKNNLKQVGNSLNKTYKELKLKH